MSTSSSSSSPLPLPSSSPVSNLSTDVVENLGNALLNKLINSPNPVLRLLLQDPTIQAELHYALYMVINQAGLLQQEVETAVVQSLEDGSCWQAVKDFVCCCRRKARKASPPSSPPSDSSSDSKPSSISSSVSPSN